MTHKIYQAIPAILADLESIGKNRKNQQQGWNFRGIDDVYNAVHPLLAKHKVFPTCEIVSREVAERTTKSGGAMFYVVLKAKYTLWAEDGTNVVTEAIGEASDSGDKASNKAMSAAYKYALFQLLCIPTEAVDPDEEAHEFKPTTKKQQADKIAAEHGMKTADQLPAVPSAMDEARGMFKRMKTVLQARKFVEWVEGKLTGELLTTKEADEVCLGIASKVPDLCKTLDDCEAGKKLLTEMAAKMRIPDEQSIELKIKIEDSLAVPA